MKTLIKILCLSSFLFAEDVYPYLSNPSKQLEFEKIRIYIEEVEEKEMYISGGSQTILLDAYEKKEGFTINQQMTTDAIQTDYRYIYNFEIKQNNKVFNELDLLFGIGLTEEAGKIINNYNKKYAIYKEEVNRLETNYKNELMQLEERKYAIGRKNKIVLGLSMIAGLALPDDNDFKYPVLGIGVIWLLISHSPSPPHSP